MQRQHEKQSNLNLVIRIVLMVLAVLLLIYVSMALLMNRHDLTVENVMEDLLHPSFFSSSAAQFPYSYGSNASYGSFDGGFAAAASNGVQVFNRSGQEIFVRSVLMNRPVVVTDNKYGAVFDVGGNLCWVWNGAELCCELETEEVIVSASVNRNGWLALCTEDSSYTGLVTVYNDRGEAVFQWYSGGGYVLQAAVSPDNKSAAVVTLTEQGSRVLLFRLNEEETYGEYSCEDVILQLKFTDSSHWAAVADQSIIHGDLRGEEKAFYSLDGKHITGILMGESGDDHVAVLYSDYQVAADTHLIVVDGKGNLLGQLDLGGDAVKADLTDTCLAILQDSRMTIYHLDLSLYAVVEDVPDISALLLQDLNSALLVQEGVAVQHRVTREERV